jgi:hypothetical protein
LIASLIRWIPLRILMTSLMTFLDCIPHQVDPLVTLPTHLRALIPGWQAKYIGKSVAILREHHFPHRHIHVLVGALYLCREPGHIGSEAAHKAWRVLRFNAERFSDVNFDEEPSDTSFNLGASAQHGASFRAGDGSSFKVGGGGSSFKRGGDSSSFKRGGDSSFSFAALARGENSSFRGGTSFGRSFRGSDEAEVPMLTDCA